MPLFADLPPQSLANGAATVGVTPAALGAGYATFFIYSFVIGLVAIALAFVVATRQRDVEAAGRSALSA